MVDTADLFRIMHQQGASDLHLAGGQPPALRIMGTIRRLNARPLTNDMLAALLAEIAPAEKVAQFEASGDVDFGFEIPGLARFRANFFSQFNGIGAVFRQIPHHIPSAAQLGLPSIVERLAALSHGLVLVTGPTGSGKSSTLAAVIDAVNRTRGDHVITIEDPIEFVHVNRRSIVSQREVATHTRSFQSALRGALREDPDIIQVGEMRDRETMSLVMEAATTGHLVFSTLHTAGAVDSVDRVIEAFPAGEQAHARSVFAEGLQAVLSQRLLRRADNKGRCAALEILIATTAVRNLIREGKSHQIASAIQTGKRHGMQALDDALMELVDKNTVTAATAYAAAADKSRFTPLLGAAPGELSGR